jgi:hypothetical protein
VSKLLFESPELALDGRKLRRPAGLAHRSKYASRNAETVSISAFALGFGGLGGRCGSRPALTSPMNRRSQSRASSIDWIGLLRLIVMGPPSCRLLLSGYETLVGAPRRIQSWTSRG